MSTLDTLKAELTAAQGRLSQIDLPGRRQRVADLDAEAERLHREDLASRNPREQRVTWGEGHIDLVRNARANALQAKTELESAVREDVTLRREIERLSGMVHAETRIEQAQAAAATLNALVASAVAAVATARATAGSIDQLIRQERAQFEAARSQAAANLLATVKAGGNADTVQTPTLDKVATLELAQEEAQQELAAAESALAAARGQAAAAQKRVSEARAGATERAHELAFAAYVDALVDHQVAHAIAYRQGFHAPVNMIIEHARPRVERLLAAVGL